jgi:hypothetical protein
MKLLSIVFILAFGLSAFGQNIEATTKDGQKIILKPDKTWEYKENKIAAVSEPLGDCSKYTETATDRMTDRVYSSGKESVIVSDDRGKTGIAISLITSGSSLIFSIKAVDKDSGCIDENAAVLILFTDGSKITLKSDGKFNCDGKVTVYFGGVFGRRDDLEELSTKKIKAMRVNTRKSLVEEDFTDSQATELFNQINCLRKLLKK